MQRFEPGSSAKVHFFKVRTLDVWHVNWKGELIRSRNPRGWDRDE